MVPLLSFIFTECCYFKDKPHRPDFQFVIFFLRTMFHFNATVNPKYVAGQLHHNMSFRSGRTVPRHAFTKFVKMVCFHIWQSLTSQSIRRTRCLGLSNDLIAL